MRGNLAVGLSTALLILLPLAGAFGIGCAVFQWAKPEGMECGLFVFPLLGITVVGGLLGLAVGLGAAWVAMLGIFRWANGSGLGDIREDCPFEV